MRQSRYRPKWAGTSLWIGANGNPVACAALEVPQFAVIAMHSDIGNWDPLRYGLEGSPPIKRQPLRYLTDF